MALEIPVPRKPGTLGKTSPKRLSQRELRVRYVTKPGSLQHLVRLLRVEHRWTRRERGKGAGDGAGRPDQRGGYRNEPGTPRRKRRERLGDAAVRQDFRVRHEEGLPAAAAGKCAEDGGDHVSDVDQLDARGSAREDRHETP